MYANEAVTSSVAVVMVDVGVASREGRGLKAWKSPPGGFDLDKFLFL